MLSDIMVDYDMEIQAYLASLSPQVTYEEILNTRAHQVRMFEKEKPAKKGSFAYKKAVASAKKINAKTKKK